MDIQEYEAMARLENTLWWYRALHDKVLVALQRRLATDARFALLDAGCGTGGLLKKLESTFPEASLHGLDLSAHAIRHARQATCAELSLGSVTDMPYETARFDVITSMDVMYHRDVDPARMLAECARVLRPSGLLVLNLPAYDWLRSYHDEHVQTARRYSLHSLKGLMTQYPFRRLYGTYWNAVLFLPLLIRRKLLPSPRGRSDVADIPGALNAIFYAIACCENPCIRHHISLPFGSSVFAVYRKT